MYLLSDLPAFPISLFLVPVYPPAFYELFTVFYSSVTIFLPYPIYLYFTFSLFLSLPTILSTQFAYPYPRPC